MHSTVTNMVVINSKYEYREGFQAILVRQIRHTKCVCVRARACMCVCEKVFLAERNGYIKYLLY